ncbi:MAG: lipoprotein insertase outer membrane protein LolB [Gammaproteobacteria bacterium]
MAKPHFPSRCYIPLVLLCLLSACATRPPVPEGEQNRAWQRHSDRIAGLTQWELKGRIALRVEEEGWTASLHWRQEEAAYVIRILAPMGQGRYELRGNASTVQLRMPDNRVLYAQDAQTLLRDNLGWQLPVEGLVWWVRGLPAPDNTPDTLKLDKRGRLQELQQDGWRVLYDHYGLFSGGIALPEKLTIERPGLRLRLLIHSWAI